jgi:hypothetical protein
VVRRFVPLVLSSFMVLAIGMTCVDLSFGQSQEKKAAQTPPTETSKKEAAKTDTTKTEPAKKAEAAKEATKEATQATEPPLPPIPPDVQAKLEAARKAVAEAIVAAQDAGLVETSIDPPPILDILITGRAIDARALKAKKPYAVTPEVFGAWFTGFGKTEGINYEKDVRIVQPSAGLKQWYDQRAAMLRHHIEEVRKAKGPAPAPKASDAKPAEPKKEQEAKKGEEATKKKS